MSILLDALKKSEEQRQLGKTPEIHDPADHDPRGYGKKGWSWLPLSMMAVAAVAITWFVWQQYREPDLRTVSGSPEVSQKQSPATDMDRAGERSPAQEDRTPVESYIAEDGEAQPAAPNGAEEQKRQDLARSFSQFSNPDPAGAEAPEPEVASTGDTATPPPDAGPAIEPQTPPATEPAEPYESEPISYWELPQNVRDSMPEFRISVMVFAEKPADRFMLINGQRLVENESIDGVELEEIRRNGAVFRYRNYRFLVKG